MKVHLRDPLNLTYFSVDTSNSTLDLFPITDLSTGIINQLIHLTFLKSSNTISKPLSAALEVAVANMSLSPLDRLSTLEDRISLVLGEKGNTVALLKLVSR